MGVHGLTTFLRENQRSVGTAHLLANGSEAVRIVVDGWSFIYDIQNNSALPWVYGGEYRDISHTVTQVIEAWLSVGFKIHFVFDGPLPTLKFDTAISRLVKSNIQQSQLFFATSVVSRNASRFLRETRIIPPLAYSACLTALKAFGPEQVQIHHADEEGDPFAVALAGKLGAYVVGNDSDFVVLNCDGYRGYIALDEMTWTAPTVTEPSTTVQDFPADDFQPVRNSKSKKKRPAETDVRFGRGLIPPAGAKLGLKLSFNSYTPAALAAVLNLPITHLPLLGALVGNDYSSHNQNSSLNAQSMFFEKGLSLSQRITKVATTLRSIMTSSSSATNPKRKPKQPQVGSAMDLISHTVNALLARSLSTMGSGQVESIIERIVDATLQYGMTHSSRGNGPLFDMFSIVDDDPSVGTLYLDAYRNGKFSNRLLDIVSTGTYWPRLFLENPECETVGRTIGRDLRIWGYSILNESVGLPVHAGHVEDSAVQDDSSDDDELIDVVESDSDVESTLEDPLAPLRGALEKLHSQVDVGTAGSVTSSSYSRARSARAPPPIVVTEYIRRGIRVAQEQVHVPTFAELLETVSIPAINTALMLSGSEDDRFTIFLRIAGSDIPSVRSLPKEQLLPVLAIRWVTNSLNRRATESGASKDREKEKWTKHEAACFLHSFVWTTDDSHFVDPSTTDPPVVTDRGVQLMAQALMALESTLHLSQIMLLSNRVPDSVHLLSGQTFHAGLSLPPSSTSEPRSPLILACHDGIEDAFGEARRKKKKPSNKKDSADTAVVDTGTRVKASSQRRGIFELLGDGSA